MSDSQVEPTVNAEHPLTSFELFVLALSVFAISNLVWLILPTRDSVEDAVRIIDAWISAIFFADFLLQVRRATSPKAYFFRGGGWIDLISCIPFPLFKLARIPRIVRVWRPAYKMGGHKVFRRLMENLAASALLIAIFLVIVVLQYGAILILIAEDQSSDANIRNGSDAVWWAYVSITTVGYGDRYPVTNAGRLVGIVVLAMGMGLFGVITGYLANLFLKPRKSRQVEDDLAAQVAELTSTVATLTDRLDHMAK